MKTAVTLTRTIQIGIENFKDVCETKVFEDSCTLLEIKKWVKDSVKDKKTNIEDISLCPLIFSDVK